MRHRPIFRSSFPVTASGFGGQVREAALVRRGATSRSREAPIAGFVTTTRPSGSAGQWRVRTRLIVGFCVGATAVAASSVNVVIGKEPTPAVRAIQADVNAIEEAENKAGAGYRASKNRASKNGASEGRTPGEDTRDDGDLGSTPAVPSDDRPVKIPSLRPLELPSTAPPAADAGLAPFGSMPTLPRVEIVPGGDRKSESDPLMKRFRDALDQRHVEPTGDLTDDVLQVLRERGSILRGSILEDPDQVQLRPDSVPPGQWQDESPAPAVPLPSRVRRPDRGFPRPGIVPNRSTAAGRLETDAAIRLAVALLRTARALEKTDAGRPDRLNLVAEMRREAVVILEAAVSPEPHATRPRARRPHGRDGAPPLDAPPLDARHHRTPPRDLHRRSPRDP